MERVNEILRHRTYRECLEKIALSEKDRVFCGHDLTHFLDVARIAYILDLEEGLGISKELLYAAALLHDIGRHLQYERGIPHEQAGAQIAEEILTDCGFSPEEIRAVTEAIRDHRDAQKRDGKTLSGLLYRSDKLSRSCFACPAENRCNWAEEKKNQKIGY